jgi:hypothetical protein
MASMASNSALAPSVDRAQLRASVAPAFTDTLHSPDDKKELMGSNLLPGVAILAAYLSKWPR